MNSNLWPSSGPQNANMVQGMVHSLDHAPFAFSVNPVIDCPKRRTCNSREHMPPLGQSQKEPSVSASHFDRQGMEYFMVDGSVPNLPNNSRKSEGSSPQ